MSDEIWIDVPDYDGRIQASSEGRIRSIRILSQRPRSGTGYSIVGLPPTVAKTKGGKCKSEHVHSLVAAAFLGPRPEGLHINHKDGNRENPKPSNLEYITQKENIRDGVRRRQCCLADEQMKRVDELYWVNGWSARAIALELDTKPERVRSYIQICVFERGKRKGKYEHKIDQAKADRIREMYARGSQIREIAKTFEISESHASRIARGFMFNGKLGSGDKRTERNYLDMRGKNRIRTIGIQLGDSSETIDWSPGEVVAEVGEEE
jgi:hypothetical protein